VTNVDSKAPSSYDLEWWICYSDSDCGLKSWMGAVCDSAEIGAIDSPTSEAEVYVKGSSFVAADPARSDPYTSAQCAFHEDTAFARGRRCWKAWNKLGGLSQRILYAYYIGMDPSTDTALRKKIKDKYGEYAAVAYWMCIDWKPPPTKEDVEALTLAAHEAWEDVCRLV